MEKKFVEYKHQGTNLEGYLVYNAAKKGDLPAVILCHAWRGRDDFVCEKAEEIASWGYAAFALDIYGKGVLGKSVEENVRLMSPFMEDRRFLQDRLKTALKTVSDQPVVDPNKIAVMGFCFGGLCALDLARSGAEVKGAISVHGLLKAPKNEKYNTIKSKILSLHGHDDPMVPPDEVLGFEEEMKERNADWQIHVYGGTMHAFTNPIANDPAFGTVYNPIAAKRAWRSIRLFLEECL
jgi:dienelactone hydrolase